MKSSRHMEFWATRMFALAFLVVSSGCAEQFWNGAISYDPPFEMQTNSRPNDFGLPLDDWDFYTWGECGTNRPAKVAFRVEPLAQFLAPAEPTEPIRTVADLKRFMDSKLRTNPSATNVSISIVQFAGREALCCMPIKEQLPQRPSTWLYAVCFFWEQNPAWQKTTVCNIELTAERRETLNILTNSLQSVRVQNGRVKR